METFDNIQTGYQEIPIMGTLEKITLELEDFHKMKIDLAGEEEDSYFYRLYNRYEEE